MNHRVITIIILTLAAVLSVSAAGSWESAERLPRPRMEQPATVDDVVTAVADGYLYISIRQRAAVRLFTILGQPVVQETLAPGVYRYRLPARGIYLLKVASITRRITL